ncbi:AraC family transcriptional regulator [Pedobacter nutrimenti]|uniref:AraC-like DNA-binding protein n=1 Tax=Pedobacter nutrimenti TaxID=1241337 RepID=A0A318ULA9_9SPHI|nr:helix-turn-helix transcriptional regulator [Pedobacter nutrimenti]PYF77236.1 AraC-like DNA-binding protein [Pedobacter nutrimenti]
MRYNIPVYDINTFEEYKNQGIFVSRFGYYSKNHKHLHTAHRHSFYHLVYFTKGSGKQHIDFKRFEVKPGLIYFMIPGQVHSWDFETEPDGYIINFSKDYFSSMLLNPAYLDHFSFFSGIPERQVLEIDGDTAQKLNYLFEQILKEGIVQQQFEDDLVRTLLLQIFIYVSRTHEKPAGQSGNSYSHTLLKNFLALIESNYVQLKFPKQYAELLYITPNHLNALCNDLLGKAAGELIRERIILEAKRLLINLDLSVSEISERLNFNDQSYFIKFFKKYEETTPDKFRKQNTQ